MLNPDPHAAPPAGAAGLEQPPITARICAICDGPAAARLMAAYLLTLPAPVIRDELSLGDALEDLRSHSGPPYRQIIIAPDPDRPAQPHMLPAVLDAAAPLTEALVLLGGAGAMADLGPWPGLRVLHPPQFTAPAPEPAPGPAADRAGRWRPMRILRQLRPASAALEPEAPPAQDTAPRVIAIQPLSGGAGASLLSANLAQELVRQDPGLQICILDLDLQFGSLATYLDLPPEPRIIDAYRSLATMDSDAFQLCLQPVGPQIRLFAAPAEILPIDSLTASDLQRLIALGRERADLVLIDLPHLISDWSAAAFAGADLVLALGLLDVRSARNSARLRSLLQAEGIGVDKVSHLLNRLPARKSRAQTAELAEFTRGIGGRMLPPIPEGGALITVACNLGQPLWREAAHNPARLAIRDLAQQLRPVPGVKSAPLTTGAG